jgi:hypothetical protein
MPWQWIVLAISLLIVSLLVGWYIARQYERRTGQELASVIKGEIIALTLILLWIAIFIGRCSIRW